MAANPSTHAHTEINADTDTGIWGFEARHIVVVAVVIGEMHADAPATTTNDENNNKGTKDESC